jgi:uncharacterized protein (TIGR02302 family)
LIAAPTADGSGESPVGGWWRRRYRLLMELARWALMWERLWPCLWPATAVLGLFVAVALLDLLPLLPFWLHSLALIAFAVIFGFKARGMFAGYRPVDEMAARHRLEKDSGLEHRPLTAIHDKLAAGADDSGARSLWRAHLMRMAAAAGRLRVLPPSPGLVRFDPYGLRAVVVMLLVIGASVGVGDATARLERALVPRFDGGQDGPLKLDVWVTPPSYTGLAPIFLEREPLLASAGGRESPLPPAVKVPVGSTLLAQAGGARAAPELKIGGRAVPFAAIGDKGESGSFRAEAAIEDADRSAAMLEVDIRGRAIARWPVQIVADAPPSVEFFQAPSRTGRAQLRIEFGARDDYGVAGVQLVIRHPEGRSVPGGASSIQAELPLPEPGARNAEGSSLQDFSAHPWAGIQVNAQLQAIDARGQAGQSDVISIVLPERIFNHPVARAIADARKRLNAPTDDVVGEVAQALRDLATRPSHFYDDTVVFLALTVSASRLMRDKTEAGIGAVQDVLWETALRIEDGEFAIAERDLRKIQESLMRALERKANTAEIERLMDELQQAIDKYMSALLEHLQKQGLSQLPVNPSSRAMDSSDLQRMIEEARELARAGAVDAARKLIAQLQRMLESLRNGMQAGKPGERMQDAQKLMDGLRDLTRRQQQELDNTFRRAQRDEGALSPREQQGAQGRRPQPGAQGQRPPSAGQGQGQRSERQGSRQRPGRDGSQNEGDGAGEQEAIRRELGRLMLQMDELLGNIPQSFGQAERAMRGAVDALNEDLPGDAVPLQTEALNQLRQGAESMAEQIARSLGAAMGIIGGQEGQRPGEGRDPFGRNPGGALGTAIDDGDVKVPDQMEMRRAREILQELRRRAGETTRPEMERDYIDRLLRRF